MSIILRSAEGPAFDRAAMQRILRAAPEYEKYKSYRDALEDPAENMGPANDDAWLFEDLHVYMRLLKRARDKEQMIELIFEVRPLTSTPCQLADFEWTAHRAQRRSC